MGKWIWVGAALFWSAVGPLEGQQIVHRVMRKGPVAANPSGAYFLPPSGHTAAAPAPLDTTTVNTGSLVYVCDSTVNAVSATACTTLNTTIAGLYAAAFSNVNARIYVKLGNTDLGESNFLIENVSYTSFRNALVSSESGPNDTLGITSSVPATNPYGTDQVQLTGPLARALGFSITSGTTPTGGNCTLGTSNCYDGYIIVANDVPLYFRAGAIGGSQFDFFTVVEHETDEILGSPSCAFGNGAAPCESKIIYPADLYRYHSDGTRSFAPGTNHSCSTPDSTNACFSLDGIHMLQQYNNLNNGDDAGDWANGCSNVLVQDAVLCSGVGNVDISFSAEIMVLDAVGYTLASSTTATVTGVTSSTANGTYGTGAAISIQVAFNENITVTGTPQLALNSGGSAAYGSGSGSGVLTFLYTVAAGQTASHLDYSAVGALTLNGGTIKGPGGTAVNLTLPAPGASGSLGVASNLVIDTAPSSITIQTNPSGLPFTVDGGSSQTAPQTLSLSQGSHTIAVNTLRSGPAGTQYQFSSWSDGGAVSHSITVGISAATYTATYTTQYLLTTSASPANGGSVGASPSSSGGYYNAGALVQLTASANAGFGFNGWSGDLSGSTNPQTLTMSAPHTVTANFSVPTCTLSLSQSASLPATGTSTQETCPNSSGQPTCGVLPETARSFTVTPSASCGGWTATSSNPGFLQITSGASGNGPGTVSYNLLTNTHNTAQSYTITIASGSASSTYTVNEAGNADNGAYRQVYALYEQLLGRDPDGAGFAFWTGSGGAGLGQMADSFLTSPEAFNSDFAVMATYQAATGIPPTYAQYAAAVPRIRNNSLTVTQLFNSLIGGSYTATTLYQNLLNRAPNSTETNNANSAGLANWFQILIGYPASNTPVNTPNNEFQSTGSFHIDHTNALYVQMVYYVTVSRDPDAAGLAFWTGVANNGGAGVLFQGATGYGTRIQILGPGTPNQGFIGSPEFQGLFAN